ncbi:LuxR C-terminal-related transcriptional regulator [Paenibacillus spongiae]|uniref:LuxR C-terminal-related transcriptional regulator n=1 Tax=Paenibacillus spongiae TaxID=2909671 RepID=A0ABY5S5M2_9BACL|nr:LuxR C-terminal-related transcriptional regulator [Paenibacillus spongiae]UVI29216.1 LuxR C-terminal-related transcriptional regulator [Paenibacillus spongiae]
MMTLKQAPMVEREKYVNQILSIIANLTDGIGAIVAIMGEPGIGKTRLSQEIMYRAGEHQCQVLLGRSYSVAKDTAYTPIIEMIQQHFRGADPDKVAAWTKDLPDLGKLFRRLQLPDPPKVGDPALEKTRLFESLACLVERMAEGQPLVIIQEDLHFADPATIDFLHYLSRGMNSFPLILAFTIDTLELAVNDHVKGLIQSLRKEDCFQQFHLSRLSEHGVTRLLTDRLGAPLPDGVIPVVMKHSEGVPLFIDELIHSLHETGMLSKRGGVWILSGHSIETIPYRMKELMKDRIQRIQSEDQKVLLYASIAKGTVSHRILHRLTQMDEDDFLTAIHRLKASGLMYEEIEQMEVCYGIYHALMKEVVIEEFPIMFRRRAYRSFIEALEESGCEDVEYLAHLYYGAGPDADPERTLDVFLKEADRAFHVYAYASAAKYYKSAFRLLHHNKTIVEDNRVPGLLKHLGVVHSMLGERSEALRYCLEAISAYEQYDFPLEIARLHGLLSVIFWESGHIEQSVQHLENGLAIARSQPDSLEVRYELLHKGLVFLSRLKRPKEYCDVYEEIQAVHKLIGTPQAAVQAKVAEIDYWTSCVYKENYEPEKVQRLIEDLVKTGAEDETLFRGCFLSAINFAFCGQHELSKMYSQRALEAAKRIRVIEYEISSYWIQVQADLLSGHWKEALPKVDLSMSKARRIDVGRPLMYAHITKGSVYAWMGQYADAQRCLDEMRVSIPAVPTKDGHIMDMLAPIEMLIALGTGRAADYYASMNRTRPYYVALPWLNLALWGEIQLAAGNRTGALLTAEELLAAKKEGNLFTWALGRRLCSKIEAASGNRKASLLYISEAANNFKRLNMPLDYGRSLLFYAGLLIDSDPNEAKQRLLQCMEIFESLDSEHDLTATQALMKKLGFPLPKPAAASANRKETELSKREMEVARLVAEGLSNNEIAEALIISPRTVSTHLEKIYRRLGINSRASLVKYLMEL